LEGKDDLRQLSEEDFGTSDLGGLSQAGTALSVLREVSMLDGDLCFCEMCGRSMEPWIDSNEFGESNIVTIVCRGCCVQFTEWVDDGIMEELRLLEKEDRGVQSESSRT
jgi:hypothetical protein